MHIANEHLRSLVNRCWRKSIEHSRTLAEVLSYWSVQNLRTLLLRNTASSTEDAAISLSLQSVSRMQAN